MDGNEQRHDVALRARAYSIMAASGQRRPIRSKLEPMGLVAEGIACDLLPSHGWATDMPPVEPKERSV